MPCFKNRALLHMRHAEIQKSAELHTLVPAQHEIALSYYTRAMDQDWTPVTLSKTNKQKVAGISNAAGLAAAKRDGLVATVSRTSLGGGSSVTGGSLRKLEESNDVFKHDTVNKELSKAITQARMVCILFSL